jgi:DNA modification methylase
VAREEGRMPAQNRSRTTRRQTDRRSDRKSSAATLADLSPDPKNANRGTDRGREALEQSLVQYGAGRSVLVDRRGRVIAGNKTVERAKALNIPLRVVRTDGRQLIAVQRDDLDLDTDPRARALAIADNRVGELDLDWDLDVLKQLRADGLDLSSFWTDEEFAMLLGDEHAGLTDENTVIAPGPTKIQPGELFILGKHRLLCGDATSADDVTRAMGGLSPDLMTTDPPYGVSYDPAWRHRAMPGQRTAVGRVANDEQADWRGAYQRFSGDVAYVWHAGLKAGTVAASLEAADFQIRSQIIWRKQHFALSRGHYHWRHEPAWYAVRKGATNVWRGDRTQTTVWDVENLNPMGGHRAGENAATGHGTQKPVQLFVIPILNHTVAGDAIYDPFCGSGTALIAAEKTGRTCVAIDIDPVYVQVAVSRWEAFTGQKARPESASARRGRR